MRVRVEGGAFAEAVAWTARALPARPAVPVLAGLLVEASGAGRLAVSCFDHEVSARAEVAAEHVREVAAPGRLLLPGRALADFTRALRGGSVELAAAGAEAELSGGATCFGLSVLPLEEYPAAPPTPPVDGVVGGPELAAAVAQVAVAAGREDALPALTGIRLEASGGALVLAATDRYRFAERRLPWRPVRPDAAAAALVPARVLVDLARTFGPSEVGLSFSGRSAARGAEGAAAAGAAEEGEGLLGVATPGRRTTTRLLAGRLPSFGPLFPDATPTTARADTARLREAVHRVSLAADRNVPLRMAFEADGITLAVDDASGARAREHVPAELDGPPLTLACTPGWLRDGLAALGGARVRFGLVSPTRPALLTAEDGDARDAGGDGDGDGMRYLMAPRRL